MFLEICTGEGGAECKLHQSLLSKDNSTVRGRRCKGKKPKEWQIAWLGSSDVIHLVCLYLSLCIQVLLQTLEQELSLDDLYLLRSVAMARIKNQMDKLQVLYHRLSFIMNSGHSPFNGNHSF